MTYSDKPSYQYLFWLNAQLEQFIKDQGHKEEEILAYLTNSLNPQAHPERAQQVNDASTDHKETK